MVGSRDGDEPSLVIRPDLGRRRFRRTVLPTAGLAVAGVVALFFSHSLVLPFEPILELNAVMGSKADYFEDPEVGDILMDHRIRVNTKRSGSRDVATHELASADFVFPSGQPAANLINARQRATGSHFNERRPFMSPIILATYRDYAETLLDNGIATRQDQTDTGDTLYYGIRMREFIALVESGTRWKDLPIQRHGLNNGNQILANSPDICRSNSGTTFLAMVAYVKNNRAVPPDDATADQLADRIKDVLTRQGMPSPDMFQPYLSPEGKGRAPVVVAYEHQYLKYQLQHVERTGRPDLDRVLLYPNVGFQTEPSAIAVKEKADPLVHLLDTDPALRRRAIELGFRVLDREGVTTSAQLSALLREKNLPEPLLAPDQTASRMPTLPRLEHMIRKVGECPAEPPR
jgi:hypothetical protein